MSKKNKKKFLLVGILALVLVAIFSFCRAEEVTTFWPNLTGTDEYTAFFKNVMSRLQSVIAYLSLAVIVIGGILYVLSAGNDKMITTAKTCIAGAIIGLALAVAAPTFLKEIKSIFFRDGVMPESFPDTLTAREMVMNVLKFLFSIFGIFAIMGLVMGGLAYLFSFGDSNRAEKAKKMILYSVIGIAVASAALILIKEVVKIITG